MTTLEHKHIPAPARGLLKSVVFGLVILSAGAAIGASLMFLCLSKPQDRYGPEPEIFAEHMLTQLGRELNLTLSSADNWTPSSGSTTKRSVISVPPYARRLSASWNSSIPTSLPC